MRVGIRRNRVGRHRSRNLNPIVTQLTRILRYSSVLFLITSGGSMADDTAKLAKQVPDGADIAYLPNLGDANLNSARIACAFGDMPEIVEESLARNGNPSPVHDYCHAVVREATSRENWGHLYGRMQPDRAVDEFNLIVTASGKNLKQYENAAHVTKDLPCELAFDAGYTWFSLNRAVGKAEPSISDDEIAQGAAQCFDPAVEIGSYTGLVAGARLAYRDIQDKLLASITPEATPLVEARKGERVQEPN